MSLQSIYTKFLTAPSADVLASDATASLHYIPTLTTIHEALSIIKHLKAQVPQLQKQEEKVLSATESNNGLVLEVQTKLVLLSSGGAYLPGLDDNFLADKVVTFPIIHIVHFNEAQQIQQIRLHWDQASLLKQVDVIGSRAKNWPIRDGKDQIRLISSSTSVVGKSIPRSSSASSGVISSKGHSANGNTSNNPTRDPHASLKLFAPRDLNEDTSRPAAVAPRASAKPPARDYHDLFVGNESDASPATVSKGRSFAGGKPSEEIIAPKKGAGKNFQPSRLFDNEETTPTPQQSPERASRKGNPKKYSHFDFGDGSEEGDATHAANAPPVKPRSKHASQWDFEDFVTPEKVANNKVRGQQVRHFGWSDDEVNEESPVKHKAVVMPRRDAETHFEFQDDGSPQGARRPAGHPRGTVHNSGLGLYQNNLYDDTELKSGQQQNQPLGNVTNISHRKHFDSQFTMTDDSPAPKDQKENPVSGDHKAAVKMMDSNWDTYDQSPHLAKKENKDNKPSGTAIKTTGDGMGARKGAGRQWGFGDNSDGEESGGVNGSGFRKGVPSRKQQGPTTGNTLWDF